MAWHQLFCGAGNCAPLGSPWDPLGRSVVWRTFGQLQGEIRRVAAKNFRIFVSQERLLCDDLFDMGTRKLTTVRA